MESVAKVTAVKKIKNLLINYLIHLVGDLNVSTLIRIAHAQNCWIQ